MPDAIVWQAADGTRIDLTDGYNRWVTRGRTGLWTPPFSLASHEVPGRPGAVVTRVKVQPREVVLPLALTYDNEADLQAALRTLAAALYPGADGWLEVSTSAGTRRLGCRYVNGLENASQLNAGTVRLTLTLRAYDPFWYDLTEQAVTFTAGEPGTFFPFFPLTLASSTVYSTETIRNGGDVEAWPVWTLTGPGNGPTLRNLTTGEALTLAYNLAAGEQVTIDTRPGVKTVQTADGDNLFADLSADSSLWALAAGDNKIQVEMDGATSDSAVSLRFTQRYWSV